MKIANHWQTIQKVFNDTRTGSVHYAIATVNDDGSPHVTPIGSLFLRDDETGFYFDKFPAHMCENLDNNPRVCVLAVKSDPNFWILSLTDGKFDTPPAVRLMGTAGKKREGTKEEIAQWQDHVKHARGTKGYDILWKNMRAVRDINFDSFEPVLCGAMTSGLWE